MLKLLRKKKVAKRIFYVLAAIIIPAFVVWGSASVLNKDKTPAYAGIIFGKKVSFDEFRAAFHGWQIQMKLQYGDKANEIAGAYFKPGQAAWDRLILIHEAKTRRIQVKDSDVVAMITGFPFLQRNGRFDPQAYSLFLRYSLGEQPKAFEEQLRHNIEMSKVFEEVTRTTIVPDDEVRKEYEKQNITTRVKYVVFPADGAKDKITVSEDDIKAFAEKNKERFKVPPQINAAYIGVEFKNDAPDAQKSAASERIKKAAVAAKQKGFETAAKEAGLDIKETGLFGFEDPIPVFGWMPELSALLFDLNASATSKVVELGRGDYLFKIKEKKDAYFPDYSAVKEKAKNALVAERSKEAAKKSAQDFIDSLKNKPANFEQEAKTKGLEIKETPLFNREGYIAELGMAEALKDAAFKLAKDAVAPEAIELEQSFIAIKSIETVGVDEEKFKKEKEEFAKQVLEQKHNKVFNDFFEELKKKAALISYVPDSLLKQP
jgi:peptidyl-prolyl cis-trans isomerase D